MTDSLPINNPFVNKIYLMDALASAKDILDLYDDPRGEKFPGSIIVKTDRLDDLIRVMRVEDEVIVTFAGTRNVKQWLSNLKRFGYPKKLTNGVKVHPGAFDAFIPFKTNLINALYKVGAPKVADGIPVKIRSHSRGDFLACEFLRIFGPQLNIQDFYSFGGPRTGNKKYNEEIERHVNGVRFRYTNNNDPVVHAPPAAMSYRHFGSLHHIDSSYKVRTKSLGVLRGTLDGVSGRMKDAVKELSIVEFVFDGISDHKLDTGYVPSLIGAIENAQSSEKFQK